MKSYSSRVALAPAALHCLLVTQLLLLVPLSAFLPVWVPVLSCCAALWRYLQYRGRLPLPAGSVRAALTVSSFVAVYISLGSLIALEATVSLLLCAAALKSLELQRRRDALLLAFLQFFIAATAFFFTQGIPVTLFLGLVIIVITAALIAAHSAHEALALPQLRLACLMVLQSLPLALVLFLVIPRLPPLWGVPGPQHGGITGVSDSMQPGDIASLSRSDALAMRISFASTPPPRREWYWRGPVLSVLEQGRWRALRPGELPADQWRSRVPGNLLGDPASRLDYLVTLQPTGARWLFGLHYANSPDRGIINGGEFQLFAPFPIRDDFRYRVESWPDAVLEPALPDWRAQQLLALPYGSNPRTEALASQWQRDFEAPRERVEAALALFRREPFTYTLNPPLLGPAPMDDFLFSSQRGFCEHYAAAFVYLMRAAGIPARIVSGYQGGEENPLTGAILVRQYDAHAWAEVWLAGEGWQRVDPTAAVSPDRIELGLEEALSGEGSFLEDRPLSPLRYRHIAWVNRLLLHYDAMNDRWLTWVLGYQADTQLGFLQRWLGGIDAWRLITVLLTVTGVSVGLTLWMSLSPGRQKRSAAAELYHWSCKQLSRYGYSAAGGEAPSTFLQRVAREKPGWSEALQALRLALEDSLYKETGDTDTQRLQRAKAQLRRALRQSGT